MKSYEFEIRFLIPIKHFLGYWKNNFKIAALDFFENVIFKIVRKLWNFFNAVTKINELIQHEEEIINLITYWAFFSIC